MSTPHTLGFNASPYAEPQYNSKFLMEKTSKRTHFKNGKPLKTEEEIRAKKKEYGKKYWKTYKRKPYTPEQKERQKAYMKKWWEKHGKDRYQFKKKILAQKVQHAEKVNRFMKEWNNLEDGPEKDELRKNLLKEQFTKDI